jgi:hypothetical protein
MAAVPCAAIGGRDGGQPVTGGVRGAQGRQPAVRRQVQRRSCQPSRDETPPGARRPPNEGARI